MTRKKDAPATADEPQQAGEVPAEQQPDPQAVPAEPDREPVPGEQPAEPLAVQPEPVEALPAEADDVPSYTVNRERLEHDGQTYQQGQPILIEDAAQARALLALGAIRERE